MAPYWVKLFNNNLENVLGFKLINHGELETHDVDESINDIECYMFHILSCYMVQKEKHTSRSNNYLKCTVYINTQKITQSVNFSLTVIQKNQLIEVGYNSINNFLQWYFSLKEKNFLFYNIRVIWIIML